jgi:NAD(P)-dependent dehydrogenase (short-subunit alcohol dehydrogenase family)
METLKGKWALVTGASRGIGRETAIALADCGCNVVVHARSENNASDTLEEVRKRKVEAFAVGADVGVPSELEQLIETVIDRIGGVDILYNNAGVMCKWNDACVFSTEEWQTVFNVNVFAVARLCAAFIPIMKERGYGRIVNVSSDITDLPQLVPYGASKWALDKFTSEIAHSLQGTNVLINAIHPGWIKTDMGSQEADYEVDTVTPGMLVPVFFDRDGPSGRKFRAQDFKHLSLPALRVLRG